MGRCLGGIYGEVLQMESHEKYKSTIGFIDILFNILVGIAFLFIVAFVLIKPESKKEDFERKAEFVIMMEWPSERHEDMDLWVQDSSGGQCSYRAPQINFMHLDKDDLGRRNDTVQVAGKTVVVNINREVVTIRGIMAGEYIINAHMYSNSGRPVMMDGKLQHAKTAGPLDVTVEVVKLEPAFTVLHKGTLTFNEKGEEQTFFRFTIDPNGKVTDFGFTEELFIKPWQTTSTTPTGWEEGQPEYESGDTVNDDHLGAYAYEGLEGEIFLGVEP